jgi:hypothetical protein
LVGRFIFGVGFFFAAAGRMPVKINNPTTAKRFTAFTHMHRAVQQSWLC